MRMGYINSIKAGEPQTSHAGSNACPGSDHWCISLTSLYIVRHSQPLGLLIVALLDARCCLRRRPTSARQSSMGICAHYSQPIAGGSPSGVPCIPGVHLKWPNIRSM